MRMTRIAVVAILSATLGYGGCAFVPSVSSSKTSPVVVSGPEPTAAQLHTLTGDVQRLQKRIAALEARLHKASTLKALRGRYHLVDTLDDVNALTAENLQGLYRSRADVP